MGKDKAEKYIGIILSAVALMCVIRAFTLCRGNDIWYDELFTMEFASRPFNEMVKLTAQDVHPPLYYAIVSVGIRIICLFNRNAGAVAAAKAVSVVPFVLILIYAVTVIRKEFGWLTAGIFSFCIMTMPQLPSYTVEIRMYGWAMFFVTAAALHAYLFLVKDRTKRGSVRDGLLMLLYGTAACYTHYYACIAVAALWLLMFIYEIRTLHRLKGAGVRGEDGTEMSVCRQDIAGLAVSAAVMTAAYIPWLKVLASQIGSVKADYWIQPLTWRTAGGCIKFLFRPDINNGRLAVTAAVIMFAIYVFSIMNGIKAAVRHDSDRENEFAFICMMVMVLLIICGFAASAAVRPVFVYRYMMPACGVWWLAFAITAGRRYMKAGRYMPAVTLITILFTAVLGLCSYRAFTGNEQYKLKLMSKTDEMFSEIKPGTRIVCNFDQVQAVTAYELKGADNSVYLCDGKPESIIAEMLPAVKTMDDAGEIRKWLNDGGRVLFFGSFNSRDGILSDWKTRYGIGSSDKGSFMAERYWFDVYELSVGK